MNNETNCCESPATENTAITTREERPTRLAEPAWNATRREDGADIEVALPGVRKEDLNVEVSGSRLVVEAKRGSANSPGRLIHGEPAPDGYRLELRLGNSLDGSALSARLESGLLRLAIPLVEAAKPKRIEIV
ncbi:Hsp20/alpha crystallin family protein [Haloferula sp. A504]|uniref:Hsp20/alpha crystallin family protein n=1 Tax=Haloferula sp. A504 TaxID=3373601 RepID=UPI0031CA6D6D|nr:Hsp20/alpha crystallin family protein [Verrucomicrobiaceae bacterium E54]